MRFKGLRRYALYKLFWIVKSLQMRWIFDGCYDFDVFWVYLLASGPFTLVTERVLGKHLRV